MTLPRMSHSRYEVYSSCGERYRLEKIEKHFRTPSIYAVAGTAFHEWSEFYDLGDEGGGRHPEFVDIPWYQARLKELVGSEEEKSGFPLAQWDTPAKRRGANETALEKFYHELGPGMVSGYMAWRDECDWTIADLPDAGLPWKVPAVELKVTYQLGDVEDIAIVDRVFDTPDGLVAIDIKTWAKKRHTAQLPSYKIALAQNGVSVSLAGYYDARKGEVTDLNDYKWWDENRLAALHEQAAQGIAAGFFLPRVTDECVTCPMRRHCVYAP